MSGVKLFFLKCAKSFGRFSSKNTSNAEKYVNICRDRDRDRDKEVDRYREDRWDLWEEPSTETMKSRRVTPPNIKDIKGIRRPYDVFLLAVLKAAVCVFVWDRVCTDKAVVHPEEGHLAGLVEQVGEGDEGVGRVQVEDQHGGDERHALHLNTDTRSSPLTPVPAPESADSGMSPGAEAQAYGASVSWGLYRKSHSFLIL